MWTGSMLKNINKEIEDGFLMFVDKDNRYTIYLYPDALTYCENGTLARIATVWIPSEKTKENIANDLGLTEKPLGPFFLEYVLDLKSGTGAHVETVNMYDDGAVARQYKVPALKWQAPGENKRIDALFKAYNKL
jgi:hypothetical protein